MPRPYNPWGRWTLYRAHREGRKDGRRGFPPAMAPRPLGYPAELESQLNLELNHISELRVAGDQRLRVRQDHAEQNRDAATKELNEVEAEYGSCGIRAKIGPAAKRFILGVLAICEYPFNAWAFEVCRLNQIYTWLLTVVPAICIIMGAHMFGTALREPKRTTNENRIMWAGAIMAAIMSIGLAYLRHLALPMDATRSSNDSFAGATGGPPSSVTPLAHGPEIGVTLAMLAFQGGVFVIAATVSFHAHDPLRHHRERLLRAEKRLVASAIGRQRNFDYYRTQAEQLIHQAHKVARGYAGEDVKNRRDGFYALPAIEPAIPEHLEYLDLPDPVKVLPNIMLNGHRSPADSGSGKEQV